MATPEEKAFLLFARQRGLVNPYQVERALRTYETLKQQGVAITIPKVFVQLGILQSAQVNAALAEMRQSPPAPSVAEPPMEVAGLTPDAPSPPAGAATPVARAAPAGDQEAGQSGAGAQQAKQGAASETPFTPIEVPSASDELKALLWALLRRIPVRILLRGVLFLAILAGFSWGIYLLVLKVREGHTSSSAPDVSKEPLGVDDRKAGEKPKDGKEDEKGKEEGEGGSVFHVDTGGEPVAATSEMTFIEFRNRVLSLLDTKEYGQAMRLLGNVPEQARREAKEKELDDLKGTVKTKLTRALGGQLEQARALRDSERFTDAISLIEPFKSLEFQDLAGEATAFIGTVEAHRRRKEARSDALIFSDVYEKFRRTLNAHNYKEVKATLQELVTDSRFASAADFLDATRDGIGAVEKLFGIMANNLKEKVGKSVFVANKPGKVVAVSGMTLKMKQGTKEFTVDVLELRAADFERMLGLSNPKAPPDLLFSAGVLCVHEGDFTKAESFFKGVPNDHPGLQKQRLFIKEIREIQALDIIEKLRIARQQVNTSNIRRYAKELLDKYGACAVVEAHRSWIEEVAGPPK